VIVSVKADVWGLLDPPEQRIVESWRRGRRGAQEDVMLSDSKQAGVYNTRRVCYVDPATLPKPGFLCW